MLIILHYFRTSLFSWKMVSAASEFSQVNQLLEKAYTRKNKICLNVSSAMEIHQRTFFFIDWIEWEKYIPTRVASVCVSSESSLNEWKSYNATHPMLKRDNRLTDSTPCHPFPHHWQKLRTNRFAGRFDDFLHNFFLALNIWWQLIEPLKSLLSVIHFIVGSQLRLST